MTALQDSTCAGDELDLLADEAERAIRGRLALRTGTKPLTVALSGIDGSGKSTLARRLAARLTAAGRRVAAIPLDPWLTPLHVRLADHDAGRHFYREAFRWNEFFRLLVDPLRETGSVVCTALLTRQPEDDWRRRTLSFEDVEVVLIEGIFLLKRDIRFRYDFSIWLDCSFETALERAVLRNQEGLSPDAIVADYRRVYFAAQTVHFEEDDPVGAADLVLQSTWRPQ